MIFNHKTSPQKGLLVSLYQHFILQKSKLTLFWVFLLLLLAAFHVPQFQLDASSDSLILENDAALEYYRAINKRYGTDNFLILTYSDANLFSNQSLKELKRLRNALFEVSGVASVVSIFDVPLFQSLIHKNMPLEINVFAQIDLEFVKQKILSNPLYQETLISNDAKHTALLIYFAQDTLLEDIQLKRDALLGISTKRQLTVDETSRLAALTQQHKAHKKQLARNEAQSVAEIRQILANSNQASKLHLGGLPMIVVDSIEFIKKDIQIFGMGVLCFLTLMLLIAFRHTIWVGLPLITCATTICITVGFLGWVGWPVTAVSSNFISLLLIMTLSVTIHLIVSYLEIQTKLPHTSQMELVAKMVQEKASPCFYTIVTTMIAFGSLLMSGIRPVIDFGLIMMIGMMVGFIISFTLFPCLLLQFSRPDIPRNKALTPKITQFLIRIAKHYYLVITALCICLFLASIWGVTLLSVENKLINYYKKSTEIYRGMALIDQKLGGTMPLDVIVDAPPADLEAENNTEISDGYWFNSFMFEDIMDIHDYLSQLSGVGKVLSLATTLRVIEDSGELGGEIDSLALALAYKKLPQNLHETLFTPYISTDGNQLRFSLRIIDSDPHLQRQLLQDTIQSHLINELHLSDDQVHFSGMFVLYNNVLQSLFQSQIVTLGVVFIAIFMMFIVSFKHVYLACIAIVPNILSAAILLAIMGWFHIPLDIMTMTIAAICVGIAVDDSIHYVHRFKMELPHDANYWAALQRSHQTVGRAMVLTTIIIALGFSILVFSNFVPTIYFGVLTAISMLIALLANSVLLPILIVMFKPLGRCSGYNATITKKARA